MKKILVFLIAALFFIFLIGGTLANFEIASSNLYTEHNKAASSTFTLWNTDLTSSITNISCSIIAENWTSSVSCPSALSQNSSQAVSFVVNVPQYVSSKTYTGTINVQGTKAGNTITQSKTFVIDIKKTLDLGLNLVRGIDEVYQNEKGNVTLRITNTGNIPITTNFSVESDLEDESLDIPGQISTLSPSEYREIKIGVSPSEDDNIGPTNVLFKITGRNETATIDKTLDDSFEVIYALCEVRESGDISLYDILNDDDLEDRDYRPLDTFYVDLKVRNNNDEEKRYAKIRAVLVYDNEEVDDVDVEDRIKIDTSDTIEKTIKMEIPIDAEDGYYYLYVSAYDDDNEDNCEQRVVKLNVEKRYYDITTDNVKIEPSKVNCTEDFRVTGNLMNIGGHDEEKIKVEYKDTFGNEDLAMFEDLEEGEKSPLFSFNAKVPENAEEGKNKITLNVYYGYDDSEENYDEVRSFEYYIDVEGNCKNEGAFSAVSQVTGASGENVYVSVTVENTGIDSDFEVKARSDWAEIISLEPSAFNLEGGDKKNVIVEIKPNSGISEGMRDLYVDIISAEKTETKTIPVYVSGAEKGFFSSPSDFWENFKSKTKETWFWITAVSVLIFVLLSLIIYFFTHPSMPNIVKRMEKE